METICLVSPGAEHLEVKKPVYGRVVRINLHSTAIIIHVILSGVLIGRDVITLLQKSAYE